jgi:hypothetical protein
VAIRSRKSKNRQYNGHKILKWQSEAVNQRTDNISKIIKKKKNYVKNYYMIPSKYTGKTTVIH